MTLHTLQLGLEWFGESAGGLNRVYAHLVHELHLLGVQSTNLVAGSGSVESASGGAVRSFAPMTAPVVTRLLALRRASAPWLRAHEHDGVIVSHFALHGFGLLDFALRRPFVVHFHGPWGDESIVEGHSRFSATAKTMIERAVYSRADAAIVLSGAFADILVSRFGVPRSRVHVIPGGVDTVRFNTHADRDECRRVLDWPQDRKIVLCVRRLVRRVGLEMLIDAAAEVQRHIPNVLFLIAGEGPLESQLRSAIRIGNLDTAVRLLGHIHDDMLPLAYRAADLSVVPTLALEGFGLITIESLAAGTPCVVTPVDALREIIAPLSPQLIARDATAASVAEMLIAALSGGIPLPAPHECMTYARSHYDWSVIGRKVKQVYEHARA